MKKKVKLVWIIALVAVIGLSMTACKEDSEAQDVEARTAGRLTITGLEAFNGSDIMGEVFSLNLYALERATNWYLPDLDCSNNTSETRYPGTISGGRVVLKVFKHVGEGSGKRGGLQSYTGDDSNVTFRIYSSNNSLDRRNINVNFTYGIASVDWSTAR